LDLGELFTLVVYGQLIIEKVLMEGKDQDVLEQIFDFMVRDFSQFALQMYSKPGSTAQQMALCLQMIKKPVFDENRFERIWSKRIYALKDAYVMNS
jgi:acyl-CoA dehydrogenase